MFANKILNKKKLAAYQMSFVVPVEKHWSTICALFSPGIGGRIGYLKFEYQSTPCKLPKTLVLNTVFASIFYVVQAQG
jgi:hypothetical protein